MTLFSDKKFVLVILIVAGLSKSKFHILKRVFLTSFFIAGFGFAVGNALKFTHKGSVTVGVRVVAEDTASPVSTSDGEIVMPICSKVVVSISTGVEMNHK